jgi:surfeit locus 1 family protein
VSWRFALRPKWIIRHVAVVALVVTMVLLGLWQLRRLDEKQAHKELVQSRQEAPAVDVAQLVPAGVEVGDDAIDDVVQRAVTATGTYAGDDTFIVENRTYNGASGAWVLTPLVLDDGSAVVVNRGFIGFDEDGEFSPPAPPEGTVTVEGIALESETRGRFGAADPDQGDLAVLARVDLERVEELVDYDVRAVYVQRASSQPPETSGEGPELVALGRPEPTEGPHLSYAVQWFTFTTIAIVGYALLLRRVARDEAQELAAAEADAAVDRELAAMLDADR